jgi:hypothetical protein
MAKIEDILDQEKTVNSDLKKQYDELAAAKASLENKLTALQAAQAQPVPAKSAQPAAARH